MISNLKAGLSVPSPSFASGFMRLLDWAGHYDSYVSSVDGEEADARALFSDWASVGDDLVGAMSKYDGLRAG